MNKESIAHAVDNHRSEALWSAATIERNAASDALRDVIDMIKKKYAEQSHLRTMRVIDAIDIATDGRLKRELGDYSLEVYVNVEPDEERKVLVWSDVERPEYSDLVCSVTRVVDLAPNFEVSQEDTAAAVDAQMRYDAAEARLTDLIRREESIYEKLIKHPGFEALIAEIEAS